MIEKKKEARKYYGVSKSSEGQIICAVSGGVEVRAADLTLQQKIEIPGEVYSAFSVGRKLITKVDHNNKHSTYIGTEENPTQTLIHEVSYEGFWGVSQMAASASRIALINGIDKELSVYTIEGHLLFSISLSDMEDPCGVHILPDDTAVLVTDYIRGELRKYPLQADAKPVWIHTGLGYATAVTSDESGYIYVRCDDGKRRIKVISQVLVTDYIREELRRYPLQADAKPVWTLPGLGYATAETSDESGYIYVRCGDGMRKIKVISQDGVIVGFYSPEIENRDDFVYGIFICDNTMVLACGGGGVKKFQRKETPSSLQHVRTEKTSSVGSYGVSWRADQKLLCAVWCDVEIRAAADLTLQETINIPGHVFSAHSVGDKLITKVAHNYKYRTYIRTEENPTQTLIHEVSYEGYHVISHMSATNTRIAVIDRDNRVLRVYTITGDHLYNINLTGMEQPYGVHILPDDTVLVTDFAGGELRKYPLQADAEPVWTLTGLKYPTGMTSDESGYIYVKCDKGEMKIKVISPQGEVIRDLYPPEKGSAYISDISVHDGMMALAGYRDFKLYKLKYE